MTNIPEYTEQELAAIREEYAKGASDAQFTLFISECRQRRLIPGVHVVFQVRAASEYDPITNSKNRVFKATKITTINALRLLAVRTKEYQGQQEPLYVYLDDSGQPTRTSIGVPLPKDDVTPLIPWAVKVGAYRAGFKEPLIATARFDAYAVVKRDGTLTDMWARRAPEQLAKCAEALALRMAFPEELGDLYIAEEFKEENEPTATPAPETSTPPPAAVSTPPVNHTPAEPKDEPRPNEEKKAEVVQKTEKSSERVSEGDVKQNYGETAGEKAKDAPQKPNQGQVRAFGSRITKAGADKDLAKAWLTADNNVKQLKALTIAQWEAGVSKIEAAASEGPEALKTLLIGKE